MKKKCGKHQSVHRDLKRAHASLLAQPGVKKVVLGEYVNCRTSKSPGELVDCGGGKYKAYTGEGYQTWYVVRSSA